MEEKQLRSIIEMALEQEEFQVLSDACMADGYCGVATDAFNDLVEEVIGLDSDIVVDEAHFTPKGDWRKEWRGNESCPLFSYAEAPHPHYLPGCNWPGHVVSRVGDWLVDWTARQFDPTAPHPLVFRLSETIQRKENE